mgnify:CR=1 FL=1
MSFSEQEQKNYKLKVLTGFVVGESDYTIFYEYRYR